MKVVKTVKEVREIVAGWRKEGLSVGLVPTMGFLHEGHQSLIRKSAEQNDRTVVSVFVNPIQFGPNEDLEAYPRDLNRDIQKVEEAGGDLIFNPEPEEMYPGHFTSFIDTTETTELLCGAVRPIHFRGVCTVVGKLFNIVLPGRAYFGQKDAQQLATIKRFVRDLNRDMTAVEEAGGDLIFNPEPAEMYPGHFTSFIDTTETTELLCGAVRPIHFRGVCTVVGKLFNIVLPDRAYFGQKDAQQLATVKRFVRDLNFPVEIVPCPIVRETDGLAKSSRNTYLNKEERQAALILSKSLKKGREAIDNGERDAQKVIDIIRESLETEPMARIDYVEVVDFENIQRTPRIEGETLVAIAVYIGKTRLIDNFIVNE